MSRAKEKFYLCKLIPGFAPGIIKSTVHWKEGNHETVPKVSESVSNIGFGVWQWIHKDVKSWKKNPDSKRDFVIMPTLHYHVPRSIDSIKGVQWLSHSFTKLLAITCLDLMITKFELD